MRTYYKFLDLKGKKIVSRSGNLVWSIGEWQEASGKPKLCKNGLHCSDKIYQAFSYVSGTVLAKVEVGGKKDVEKDKHCHQKMRIVQAWEWDKMTSVKLAIYAAELVIDIYEKQYPNDKRPREAIEATKKYLKKPTKANADAACAASYAAAHAADAADAAHAAAHAAAYAAVRAAADAADAAYAAPIKKIDAYMLELAKDLKELK